ncbi:hypothetical protein [Pseudoalteromonas sp. OF7H-1]|uniref:hypothetical protein n=1 Tax=Pseudoalteromonas sp. OF7H-1 TaxID=2917755 RepID=UPI001EF523F3|nr:hypothetical protein [Pseudoalteromonas sp. OF7H-1]MCG7539037.1 hypothetical protein [Pseudoalteromonas sp. OF7H-1]
MSLRIIISGVFISSSAMATSLDDINAFAHNICGKVETSGSISSIQVQAAIEGQINPKALAKILGGKIGANGSITINDTEYKGLPYDELPSQMSSARQCRKEVAFMLLEERRALIQAGNSISRYAIKSNRRRMMLMKVPDFESHLDIFNRRPNQIKVLLDDTKIDLLEQKSVMTKANIPLVWHKIKVISGKDSGLIGWLPEGHVYEH